jgi:preprotein translocase subunit SecG
MNIKNLMVFFLTIVAVLFLVTTISAAEVTNDLQVTIDDIDVSSDDVSVIAGEVITLKAFFTSNVDASDVKFRAELEGEKVDVKEIVGPFDLEDGIQRRVTLKLRVPYELKDEVSDDLRLSLKLYNKDHRTDESYDLRVQRQSYNVGVMSIRTKQTVDAGETISVDVVLKNIGYNYLDDLYVTAKIPTLGLERTSYFGDLVQIECVDDEDFDPTDRKCDIDDEDTVSGRFNFKIPYDAEPGIYSIEVEVENDDLTTSEIKQIVVENEFSQIALKSGSDLIVLNPTNKLKVYTVVTPTSETLVIVPAGSSRTVAIDSSSGNDFDVSVLSNGQVVSTVTFTGSEQVSSSSPVVVLTVILAIIFIVLLIVLIVLIGKKPEKSEEFGESYY